MFRIKICGITNVSDARSAAECGADAIGLNFWPQSTRYVAPDVARQITIALPADLLKIGVFVNERATEIGAIAAEVGLDGVQLHGDEPPEFAAVLPSGLRVIRAFRCGREGLVPLQKFLDASRASGRSFDAVLMDADAGPDYGGTGRAADWPRVARERSLVGDLPLVLAGGLSPENVREAIVTVRPDGVDVASGVEAAPGRKDRQRLADFVAAARAAFAE